MQRQLGIMASALPGRFPMDFGQLIVLLRWISITNTGLILPNLMLSKIRSFADKPLIYSVRSLILRR